jgi:hypothetical protein
VFSDPFGRHVAAGITQPNLGMREIYQRNACRNWQRRMAALRDSGKPVPRHQIALPRALKSDNRLNAAFQRRM